MFYRPAAMAAIACASFLPQASAQQALSELERRLQAEVPSAEAAATAPEPGYLGILADESFPAGRGTRLVDVLPGGPAALAGLRVGDLITSIDGHAVQTLDDMAAVLRDRVVGERVAFVAIRGIEAFRGDVVLTRRPPPEERRFPNFGKLGADNSGDAASVPVAPPAPQPPPPTLPNPSELPSPPTPGPNLPAPTLPVPTAATPAESGDTATARTGLLGIRVVDVTPELQLAMNLTEPKGALVVEVRPNSSAAAAGIPVGAVITSAIGKVVDSPADLAAAVRSLGEGAELKLSYSRYGQSFEKTVKLTTQPATTSLPVVPTPNTPTPPAAPKSVADENAQLRARVAELEARLKALEAALEKSASPPK